MHLIGANAKPKGMIESNCLSGLSLIQTPAGELTGFFSWGWGDWAQVAKILPVPTTNRHPCFLSRTCPPQRECCSRKFQKFYLIFLSILTTFKQNSIRKLYLMLKTPKFALTLLKGAFLATADNFSKSPLIWLRPSPPPPTDSIPLTGTSKSSRKQVLPHQNFFEKTLTD